MEAPGSGRMITGDKAIAQNLRCNERIRISPIRLVDENDQQLGIVEIAEALAKAQQAGMDLVEVAPQSKPPVCRIMDYGKWKYAQNKKEQKSKSHRHETELKEIRIKTPKIGDHDLQIKVTRAREFLQRGDRVQFTLRFRGRELAHIDEGQKFFASIREQLADVSKIDQDYRREGKRITMTLASTGKKAASAKSSSPAAKIPQPTQAPAPQPSQPAPESQAIPQMQQGTAAD